MKIKNKREEFIEQHRVFEMEFGFNLNEKKTIFIIDSKMIKSKMKF